MIVTDDLGLYSEAFRELGLEHLHFTGGRLNNWVEVSHQPTRRRERLMGRLKSRGSMQRFLSVHDALYNQFDLQRHLVSRQTRARAFAEGREIVTAWFRIEAVHLVHLGKSDKAHTDTNTSMESRPNMP